MFVRPRLKQSFAAEVVAPRALFLLNEYRQLVFEGEVYTLLAPLLDGRHTFGELLSRVGQQVTTQDLFTALTTLARRGCVVEGGESLPDYAAYWDHMGVSGPTGSSSTDAAAVTVATLGGLDRAALAAALTQAQLRVGEEGSLEILATDDYLRPELEARNRQALSDGRPWMLVKPVGMVLWVGPIFRPGQTACWKCLQQRLRANRQVEGYIQNSVPGPVQFRTSRAWLPSTFEAGLQFAALEASRAVLSPVPPRQGAILYTLDVLSLELKEHTVVRRPQCPACGHPDELRPRPVELTSRPKRSGAQEHRSATAAETFERYKHHVSPITGIVTSLTSREDSQYGLTHNYVASHYFPIVTAETARLSGEEFTRLADDLRLLHGNMVARSGGKGATDVQARTSAICESIERYSGISWGDESSVRACLAELGPAAIHPRDVLLFSDQQYRERKALNAGLTSGRHYVPPPFDEAATILWSPAWSLTHSRWRHLPKAHCFYGHWDRGHFFCSCDSNGCATGNSLEEAIVQGFLELVERDSVALWWYNRLRRPPVDLASFQLPYVEKTRTHYLRELHRDLHALDVTADLGIPTFVVVSRRLDRSTEDIILGVGSHLDPRAALLRAVAEANQYLPSLRFSYRDGSTRYLLDSQETIDWCRTATYANQPYLLPAEGTAGRRPQDFAPLAGPDLLQDVQTCVRLAASRGLETLVVDQTRPDIGLPVVKVVVPGLRHFWRRLGPGRLYDVPVALGWLDEPLAEADLNPIPCFV